MFVTELDDLLKRAENYEMTEEEKEEQRRSWAYGNIKLHNQDITREIVDRIADDLKIGKINVGISGIVKKSHKEGDVTVIDEPEMHVASIIPKEEKRPVWEFVIGKSPAESFVKFDGKALTCVQELFAARSLPTVTEVNIRLSIPNDQLRVNGKSPREADMVSCLAQSGENWTRFMTKDQLDIFTKDE